MGVSRLTILTEEWGGDTRPTWSFRRRPAQTTEWSEAIATRGGPAAVERSLVQGLERLGVQAPVNPSLRRLRGSTAVCLSGLESLAIAIELREAGKIDRLLAGPNLVVLPDAHGGIVASPAVDVCLVPSEWVKIAYADRSPGLAGRLGVWSAGVDERYWAPGEHMRDRMAVVYSKGGHEETVSGVCSRLSAHGLEPEVVSYGRYLWPDWKDVLDRASIAVFISRSESQGIAQAEAWAMGVPTFVWDPAELTLDGYRLPVSSSCPLLSDATGKRWRELDELDGLLAAHETGRLHFNPRGWLLEHLTDVHAARSLLTLAFPEMM